MVISVVLKMYPQSKEKERTNAGESDKFGSNHSGRHFPWSEHRSEHH